MATHSKSRKQEHHDFAPAWLKISFDENSAGRLSTGNASGRRASDTNQSLKPTKPRHFSVDQAPNWNQASHSSREGEKQNHQSRPRHRSVDADNPHYKRQLSDIRNSDDSQLYHHGRPNDSGHLREHGTYTSPYGRVEWERENRGRRYERQVNGSSSCHETRKDYFDTGFPVDYRRARHRSTEGDQSQRQNETHSTDFNTDFPSLGGKRMVQLAEPVVATTTSQWPNVNGGVWDNPPSTKVLSSGSRKLQLVQKSLKGDVTPYGDSINSRASSNSKEGASPKLIVNQSHKNNVTGSSILKALIPKPSKKVPLTKMGSAKVPAISSLTTSITKPSTCSPVKLDGQQPRLVATPPVDILVVKQPKTLQSNKSAFLRQLRGERKSTDEEYETTYGVDDDLFDCEANNEGGDHVETSQIMNGIHHLNVDYASKSKSLTPPAHEDLLSSSLEAEQRLLREMGWTGEEEEDEFSPLTEQEMIEFQQALKQRTCGESSNHKPFTVSPPSVNVTTPPAQSHAEDVKHLNIDISSSSEDDSDVD